LGLQIYGSREEETQLSLSPTQEVKSEHPVTLWLLLV